MDPFWKKKFNKRFYHISTDFEHAYQDLAFKPSEGHKKIKGNWKKLLAKA